MSKRIFLMTVASMLMLSPLRMSAQQTFYDMEQLTVNEHVTTLITSSEPVRLVDISTDQVVGDKPIENVVRLKPVDGKHEDGDVLAIATIITERYRVQYALVYTTKTEEAVSDKEIRIEERQAFTNPAVSMSREDMVCYARKIWNSPARYRHVHSRKHRVSMRLNNIYTVGEYIFIDFSVENKINLRYDIDELRVKLSDKKQSKSTNVQTIEMVPELVLDESKFFRHGYRNVIVLKKMTFPDDKVLTIEMSEKQISGRNISMSLDYEDVLAADTFDSILLKEE